MRTYKALIENSPDAISLVNETGRVLYASASSATVFGYLPEELVGRNAFDLIHPEDHDQSRSALHDVLEQIPSPRQVELRFRRKDGEWRWVESTLSCLRIEPALAAVPELGREETVVVVNSREIGMRKAARKQEERRTQELIRYNAQLEDFAHAVAHDLREPLRTISMFTDLLVRESKLDAEGNVLARFIVDGVTRMSALLDGLHAYVIRGSDDPPHPVDLGYVMAEVLRNLGHAISTSNAIVTVDPLPLVQGNERDLSRVFQNLVINAIKYRSDAPVEIFVTAEPLGLDWIVKVKDNGIGIAPIHHQHVFQFLKRLHGPETPGSGLGLAICKKNIEAMGGAIWVESELGSGSVFCFTIPAAKQAGSGSSIQDDVRDSNRGQPNVVEAASRYDIAQSTGERGMASAR